MSVQDKNGNERTRETGGMGPRPPRRRPVLGSITFVTRESEEQEQVEVPVNQEASMLERMPIDLISDMRSRAQVSASLAERISLTRDITMCSLTSFSMRRG